MPGAFKARLFGYVDLFPSLFEKIKNIESVKPLLFYCRCLPITFLANLNKLLFWKKLMVCDNPIMRWLATRRKENMCALACKLNIDCDLLVTSRREIKSRVWQCFERSIDGYL